MSLSIIVRCCSYGDCTVLGNKIQADKRTELRQTVVIHLLQLSHTCSGVSVITSAVCTAGVVWVFIPRHIYHKWIPLYVMFPPPVSSPSIHSHLSPTPGLDDTFIFHKSIFETAITPHCRESEEIYKSEVLKMLNNQFCHFLPVCFKTQWWSPVVKLTQVNNNRLRRHKRKRGAWWVK